MVHQREVDAVEHGLTWSRLPQMSRRDGDPHDAGAPGVRSADSTSVRHHHGSERKPSPMPSTRARMVVLRTRSVIPLRPATSAKAVAWQRFHRALRHRPAGRREEPGAQAEVLEHPVGAHQPQVRLMRRQRRELAAPLLGRGLVEAVQNDGVAAGPPRRQPLDGRRVLVESVAALQPWCDKKRRRHRSRVQLFAERGDVGQRLLTDAGDRDDQLSSHMRYCRNTRCRNGFRHSSSS